MKPGTGGEYLVRNRFRSSRGLGPIRLTVAEGSDRVRSSRRRDRSRISLS